MTTTAATADELLRQARAANGWSQRDLAAAAGVPPSTVGRIESGSRQPTYSLLVRLLRSAGFEPHVDLRRVVAPSPHASAPTPASRPATPRRSAPAPVEVPSDLTRLRGPRDGVVHLPESIYASGQGNERAFDLSDEAQRIELYETVLTNGTAPQVEELLNLNELLRLWPTLWLPRQVQIAWLDAIPFAGRASA